MTGVNVILYIIRILKIGMTGVNKYQTQPEQKNRDDRGKYCIIHNLNKKIGMTGFEPATPSSRTKCATKLRYIPILYFFFIITLKV